MRTDENVEASAEEEGKEEEDRVAELAQTGGCSSISTGKSFNSDCKAEDQRGATSKKN